jgi:serine/threonine protein kinase
MHARDIVHCDIKSDNVFFDAQGHVKIGPSLPLLRRAG